MRASWRRSRRSFAKTDKVDARLLAELSRRELVPALWLPSLDERALTGRARQMSREWFNDPANPAMAEWSLQADNLYAGVMLVDLASPMYRLALSGNFETPRRSLTWQNSCLFADAWGSSPAYG
jgi:hypothetical protein